ncbi:methyl-accepting chemotaxis protein [Phreatobacter aquaticus]|nr:HAMP domain-containing methyl-accepting chemotaxis protein [Phreatobacter aquaticus]
MMTFRIGTKLMAISALGVFLVAGLIVNQRISNSTVDRLQSASDRQQAIAMAAMEINTSVRRSQVAVRDIRLSRNADELNNAVQALEPIVAATKAQIATTIRNAAGLDSERAMTEVGKLYQTYSAGISDLVTQQKANLAELVQRNEATAVWQKAYAALLISPAFTGMPDSAEAEIDLRAANAAFDAARAASWRFIATGEVQQQMAVTRSTLLIVASAREAANRSTAKPVQDAIEVLIGAAEKFIGHTALATKLEDAKNKLIREQVTPAGIAAAELIAKTVQTLSQAAALAKQEAEAEAAQAATISLGLGLFVVLVLIGSTVYSMVGVIRPINTMTGAMATLASGDTSVDIPGVGRSDEIGRMASAVQVFKDNALAKVALEHEQEVAKLRAEADKTAMMNATADSFEQAVGGIVAAVSASAIQLQSAAQTMSAAAEETSNQSTVVANASEEASTNVQSVSAATDQLTGSVEEISRQVANSARIAAEAEASATATTAKVERLAHAATKIGAIVELISNIAGQTNLLALNATIEAARAGEAGKGFAVVASEVKNLAEQTGKATSEISAQINEIQASTSDSATAISEITGIIQKLNGIASGIASAVEEQGAATREIARNVQQAAQGTQEVSANIAGVTRAAEESSAASAQVLGAAGGLSQQSDVLRAEVDRFLAGIRAA